MPTPAHYILKLACDDAIGIVAAVSALLTELRGCIVESHSHSDLPSQRFFMRQVIDARDMTVSLDDFRQRFTPIAQRFNMDWLLRDAAARQRVVVCVSKQDHCLNDLLYRWRSGDMRFDLAGVISNHDDARAFVEWHNVPYTRIPIPPGNSPGNSPAHALPEAAPASAGRTPPDPRALAFQQLRDQFEAWRGDTLVLARYMQVLPPDFCAAYPGRIINIHHSFLPSFTGPRPYHQAYDRGVKWVGATSHYVTAELDAGPIIEQDAARTHHAHGIEEMVRLGRDVEAAVLARALRYHLEDRVFIQGNKTVVFAT